MIKGLVRVSRFMASGSDSASEESGRRRHLVSTAAPGVTSVTRAVVRGVVGGFIATTVMTLYRIPVFRALPPTAEFWAKFVGSGEAEQYPIEGLLLHFGYGGAAGGLFGLAFGRLSFETDVEKVRSGIFAGLGFGLLLSVFGTRVVFDRLLDEDLETDEALVFHVGHAIYGLTLGTWLSSREAVGEVYE